MYFMYILVIFEGPQGRLDLPTEFYPLLTYFTSLFFTSLLLLLLPLPFTFTLLYLITCKLLLDFFNNNLINLSDVLSFIMTYNISQINMHNFKKKKKKKNPLEGSCTIRGLMDGYFYKHISVELSKMSHIMRKTAFYIMRKQSHRSEPLFSLHR